MPATIKMTLSNGNQNRNHLANVFHYNSNFTATNTTSTFFVATTSKMNLDKLDIVSPFTFEVDSTGSFKDKGKMDQDAFASLIAISKAKGKKIYPTVLWANGDEIHKVLKDKDLQDAILNIHQVLTNYNSFERIEFYF